MCYAEGMGAPDYIDAEYEVIEDPRPRPLVPWSFWADDVPNLVGIVSAVVAVGVVGMLFR